MSSSDRDSFFFLEVCEDRQDESHSLCQWCSMELLGSSYVLEQSPLFQKQEDGGCSWTPVLCGREL